MGYSTNGINESTNRTANGVVVLRGGRDIISGILRVGRSKERKHFWKKVEVSKGEWRARNLCTYRR